MTRKRGSHPVYHRKWHLDVSMGMFTLLMYSLLWLCGVMCQEICENRKSAVVTLSSDNILSFTEKNVGVVLFTDPRCRGCGELEREYEKAATILKDKGRSVKLAKIDCDENLNVVEMYRLLSFPYVLLFKEYKFGDEILERTATDLVDRITELIGPPLETVDPWTAALLLSTKGDVTFIGRFKDNESEMSKIMKKLSESYSYRARFVWSFDENHEDRITRVMRNVDNLEFTGKSEKDLRRFIMLEGFQLCDLVTSTTLGFYGSSGRNYALFFGSHNHYDESKASIEVVAAERRSDCLFGWVDAGNQNACRHGFLFPRKIPSITYRNERGTYILSDPNRLRSSAEIIKFIDDANAQKHKLMTVTEVPPEHNDGPVKDVVMANFKKMVYRPDKDVMLLLYSDLDEDSLSAVATLRELAKERKNVVMAQMDARTNTVSDVHFDVSHLPRLFFIPANSQIPFVFAGPLTLSALRTFMRKYSSKPKKKKQPMMSRIRV